MALGICDSVYKYHVVCSYHFKQLGGVGLSSAITFRNSGAKFWWCFFVLFVLLLGLLVRQLVGLAGGRCGLLQYGGERTR